MRTPLTVLLCALAVLAIGGCSVGTTTIDSDKAEKEITKGFEQQVPDSEVDDLSCPDDVEAKKDVRAECDIELSDGRKGTIKVRVLNEDGDIRWNVGSLE